MSPPRDVQNKFKEFRRKFKENPKSEVNNLGPDWDFADEVCAQPVLGFRLRMIIGVVGGEDYCVSSSTHHDEAIGFGLVDKKVYLEPTKYLLSWWFLLSIPKKKSKISCQSDTYAFSKYLDEQLLRIGVTAENLSLGPRVIGPWFDKYETNSTGCGRICSYLWSQKI